MSTSPVRVLALSTYAAATALHLVSLQVGWVPVEWVTKPLLALSLLAYVASCPQGSPRGVVAVGLGCALAGDVVLQFPGTAAFAVGILCFAGMQVCYSRGFIALGALRALRTRPAIPACYAVVLLALEVWLVPKVGGGLAAAVALYGALLVSTAAVAAGAGLAAAVGGALFLISDTAIAARAFAGIAPPTAWFVMATYAAAQVLLVTALVPSRAQAQGLPAASA